MKEETKRILLNLAYAIVPVILVAVAGYLFTIYSMDWFNSLNEPAFSPPDWFFGVAWGIIYVIFMFIIYSLLSNKLMDKTTIILLLINGILNIAWCAVFFGLQSLVGGLIIIILHLISAILLSLDLLKKNNVLGYLSLILPVWLIFATGLNIGLIIVN